MTEVYDFPYEPCCTKANVVWQHDYLRYECPTCGSLYDDEEYTLLPKLVERGAITKCGCGYCGR